MLYLSPGSLLEFQPVRKPYTGTLLPVLVQVFDYEVDLESSSVSHLEQVHASYANEARSICADLDRVCSSLEPQFKRQMQKIKDLQSKLAKLKDKQSNSKEAANAEPTGNSTDETISSGSGQARLEEMINKEKLSFKTASGAVRKLYRKIVMLCHPDRVGKDGYLSELFELATEARKNNDENALKQILEMAVRYSTSQGKLQVLNFLRQKRKVLKTHINEAKQTLALLRRSPVSKVKTLLEQGRIDQAHAIYKDLLTTRIDELVQAVQLEEMRVSARTGLFSNNNTRTIFRM